MPDYDESKFMLAAEKAVKDLQVQAKNTAALAAEAKKSADRSDASAKLWRRLTVLLGFFIVLSLIVGGVTAYYVNQTRNQSDSLRQQSISSCISGNQLRTQLNTTLSGQFAASNQVTETAISEFITVLEGKTPKPEIVAIATALEAQIKNSADMTQVKFQAALNSALALRDCSAAYTPSATAPSSAGAVHAASSLNTPVVRE